MRQVAIATSSEYVHYHRDDASLIHAMPHAGLRPVACVWSDPNVVWEAFDAVLIRTIWDYYRRYPEFLAWLARLEAGGVRVVNPVPTLRWNADKRYLLDLETAGLPVIPTRLVESATLAELFALCGWNQLVLKPAVSAGAWDTLRLERTDSAGHEAEFARLRARHTLIAQPYMAEVADAGEWSLLFFGRDYSHAVLKRPAAGDFRVQEKHGGVIVPGEPSIALIDQATTIVRALPELGHRDCLYARVDGVEAGGRLLLMELELIEPQLFLAGAPQAGAHFARLLAAALSRA
jgi:glutathione synthase/RimK-type ligase-like ATP-grasp enzyme